MSFLRLKNIFGEVTWGGITFRGTDIILVNSSAHYGQLVKVGTQYTKTEYTHVYYDHKLLNEIYDSCVQLSVAKIRRIRHHMTRRIWMLDGVFECIEWHILRNLPDPKKSKLLPPEVCFWCMKEGNKYVPKQVPTNGPGLCRCCGKERSNLYDIRYGWPLDLRHKGFGFTVIPSGNNFTRNKEYYKNYYDMSIYEDYNG